MTTEGAKELISDWLDQFPLSKVDEWLLEDQLRDTLNQRPAMIAEIREQFTWWLDWGSNKSPKWDTQKYNPGLVAGILPSISRIRDFLEKFNQSITDQNKRQIMSGTLYAVTRLRNQFDCVVRNKKPN
jgi:hypothetical protein